MNRLIAVVFAAQALTLAVLGPYLHGVMKAEHEDHKLIVAIEANYAMNADFRRLNR